MNKASGGDVIPVEHFQSWKMMLWKCCTQYASKFGKLGSGHRTRKHVFIPIPKKGNAKESSNYHTIALISHASKVMLKILQARLQQYMNHDPDVQAGFRKGKGTRDQIASICWIEKQESSRKTSISVLLTMPKLLTVWITVNCGKSWKMMLWKCCTQYASKSGKLSSGHRTGKGQFSFQTQRKAMPKNAQTTTQLHSCHLLIK